ncbi:hypothetical protein LTR97_012877 [Elasticomyces elasticus]|uniref:Integral membrane protein n=1 Tax=Elasticomyces elasticus TaxID=574655 RepID=A0AAN7VW85_9PEZI|nr:hypothetical protein LTR97_012877 [Elasticomyces elasticus]
MSVNATETPASHSNSNSHQAWMYAHITTMLMAWIFCMPAALMLESRRPTGSFLAKCFFLLFDITGMVCGIAYRILAPDLYPGNAHQPLGWIVSLVAALWIVLSIIRSREAGNGKDGKMCDVSVMSTVNGDYLEHGRERNGAGSLELYGYQDRSCEQSLRGDEDDDRCDKDEDRRLMESPRTTEGWPSGLNAKILGCRIVQYIRLVLMATVLPLGFAAIVSGLAIWFGIFRSRHIFSGLAHCIKGGIFFFYGLLTFARYLGAFADVGWAWNVRPAHSTEHSRKGVVPSAEFTESFVICAYGASNVFLEHLNATRWTHVDLEHVSITVLFFGGGLLGMVLESSWVKRDSTSPPSNPLPALTILLLGAMMSMHHQSSHLSAALHAQWGTLLCGFAFARAATYILLHLSLVSAFPGKPFTEVVAAFCLVLGGLLMMLSAQDCVEAMDGFGLESMTVSAIGAGAVALVLAWEATVIGLRRCGSQSY